MPIIKTEILGTIVEINYEKEEKDRLEHIINKFNERVLDFKNLEGKISDAKILYLAALKAEDEVADLLKQRIEEKDKKNSKINTIEEVNKEIIKLKDKIEELRTENINLKNLCSTAYAELEKIENNIDGFINKKLDDND